MTITWFLSFRLRTFQFPRGGSVLKQRSDLNFNSVTIFMMTNVNVQDWANFSYSYESSLLLEISDRYEAAYILGINVPFRSVLRYQV